MTLKLYFAPGACSFVPHAMLELAGATFEPVLVRIHKGEQDSPTYRAVNPRGQVPVLMDGGEAITQIPAIVSYIDARFPEANFIPHEPLARARFHETLAWMNNTVHPAFTHIFMPRKFSDDQGAQEHMRRFGMNSYRALLGELQALVEGVRAGGRDWLSGVHPGPLDAYALTLTRWGTLAGIDPAERPALWAHVQRTAQVPAIARAIERERLTLNLYKPD